MTRNEPLSRQDMDQLLRFLPLFEAPDYAPVEAWAGVAGTPEGTITAFCPVYTAAVIEFFALAGRRCRSDEDDDPLMVGTMLRAEGRRRTRLESGSVRQKP